MILATTGSTAGATTKSSSAAPAATRLWGTKAFWHLCFHAAAYPFTGVGLKLLSTTIFQVSYGTSFLVSSYLSALSLIGLIVVRAVAPLVVYRFPVLVLVTALMSVNAVLFALYPTIVATCSLWVLVAAKTVANGNFAGISAVQDLLLMRVVGATNLGSVQASLGTAQFIGFAAGPLVGQYSHMLVQGGGKPSYASFFPFFYSCAAVAALGVINLLYLGIGLAGERDTGTQTSTPKDENTDEKSSEAV
jgi:hypothetical protein